MKSMLYKIAYFWFWLLLGAGIALSVVFVPISLILLAGWAWNNGLVWIDVVIGIVVIVTVPLLLSLLADIFD